MISVCLLHLNATPENSIALITLLCVLLGSATITGSWQCSRSLSLFSPHVATPTIPPLGSFFNYINQILPIFDHPPFVDIGKVYMFWEGHKILRSLHRRFDKSMQVEISQKCVAFSEYMNFNSYMENWTGKPPLSSSLWLIWLPRFPAEKALWVKIPTQYSINRWKMLNILETISITFWLACFTERSLQIFDSGTMK